MTDNKPSKLRVSGAKASEKIHSRIEEGKKLLKTEILSEDVFAVLKQKTRNWTDYNKTLFGTLFDESPLPEWHGIVSVYIPSQSWIEEANTHTDRISRWINDLESIYGQLELYEELPSNTPQTMNNENKKIFIGHGRSLVWLLLKDFIKDTLKLPYEEFNRVSAAGEFTGDRLKKMLEESCMAFLIMTGEDEQADGSLRARENVIHEVGLFQGRLGFRKAIILLEDGCRDFSNIHGLIYIPFPKGKMEAAFEEIRRVLKRESILE